MAYDPQNPAPPVQPVNPSDERTWMTLTDVGGIFFGFIPSLVVHLVFKDRSGFLRRNAGGAFNFQITVLIGYAIGSITSLFVIGGLILLAVWVVNIVFSILAAVAANKGLDYRYPLQIPIFK